MQPSAPAPTHTLATGTPWRSASAWCSAYAPPSGYLFRSTAAFAIAASAAGSGPNGPSLDASFTTWSRPSSRLTSSIGRPGWYGVRLLTLARKNESSRTAAIFGTRSPYRRRPPNCDPPYPAGVPELGLFPLPIVLVPTERIPLHIFEPRYRELIGECLETDGEFGLVLATGDGAVHEIGTRARVAAVVETLDDGALNVVVEGGERFRLLELTDGRSFQTGLVEDVLDDDEPVDDDDAERALKVFRDLAEAAESDVDIPEADSPDLVWELAARVDFGVEPKQEILASTSPPERMRRLVELLQTSLDAVRLEQALRERAGQNGKVTPLNGNGSY